MKIAIGTAQFGMDYGLSNQFGKSEKNEVSKILQYANQKGIRDIDTSPSYGDSEHVLGKVINDYDFRMITKTPIFSDSSISNFHSKMLNKSFYKSLSNLGKGDIYGLLIHSCDDLLKPGGELLFKEMENLKSTGRLEKIGVSVYNSSQIELVLDRYIYF